MATKLQNSSLSGALMLLCVTTGLLIVGVQWRNFSMPKLEFPKLEFAAPKPETPTKPNSRLVVDLSDRQVKLYKKDKLAAKYPIAIGKEGWETPTGSFKVIRMLENPTWQHPITGEKIPPGERNPLGKRWIEFTAQDKLLIGFHGTTDYSLLGEAVSHGCIRMKNAHITALYKEVAIGTPVIVQP